MDNLRKIKKIYYVSRMNLLTEIIISEYKHLHMKLATTVLLCLAFYCQSSGQTYKMDWGDEMKVKKGSMDMDIVHADNTGVYMVEGRMKMKSYFVIGYSVGEVFKFYKFDPNYNVVYDKEYKKELKGLSFNSIQPLLGQLYLFAHDYKKKEKEYIIYGAKLTIKPVTWLAICRSFALFNSTQKKMTWIL